MLILIVPVVFLFKVVVTQSNWDECASAYIKPNVRIVGGITAEPYSWPGHVLIRQRYRFRHENQWKTVSYKCGGTLIHRQIVVTAAHCINTYIDIENDNGTIDYIDIKPNIFYSSLESTLNVFAGIHNLTFEYEGSTPPLPGIRFNVSKAIIHPNFDENTFENDIALLVLKENVTTNEYIKLACLPKEKSSEFPRVDTPSWIVGWGHLNEDGDESEELQNVRVKILPNEYCSQVAKETAKFWYSQLCSGNFSGGQDACQGDSGGGLYTQLESRFILSGIVSYGDGCARPMLPGIYTRVSYYLNWIEEEIKKLYPDSNEKQPNFFQSLLLTIKTMFNAVSNFVKSLF